MSFKESFFNLLQSFRLEKHYNELLRLGVEDERDLIDSVSEENLTNMGMTQVEKERYENMKKHIQTMGIQSSLPSCTSFKKSVGTFSVKYRLPKCPELKIIKDMDPHQNTVDDLILRICHQEALDSTKTVVLFTYEGMPLSDDPFFNTWSLHERHIENGSEIYVIITLKQNVKSLVYQPPIMYDEFDGDECTIRCHVMLKGDYEISVNLSKHTLSDLKEKLYNVSGIPPNIQHFRDSTWSNVAILESLGITENDSVHIILSSESISNLASNMQNFHANITPVVHQTPKGLSMFFSSFLTVNLHNIGQKFLKVIALIRRLTGCHVLAQALYQIVCKNELLSKSQKIAVMECLYILFREILSDLTRNTGRSMEDGEVFENSNVCWALLIGTSQNESIMHEVYAPMSLVCNSSHMRFSEPVRVPGITTVYEKEYVRKTISEGVKIPGCTEKNLNVNSIKRATDIEKILFCTSQLSFPLWTGDKTLPHENFYVRTGKTFGEISQSLSLYPYLQMTPPLRLKNMGIERFLLVFKKKDSVAVYLERIKMSPSDIKLFCPMERKEIDIYVDQLAAKLQDFRTGKLCEMNRIPEEAILVLMDCSSSMIYTCYDTVNLMRRIDAIKQVFHAFADRSMAYDFHHVIGLIKFGGNVQVVHTFTETLETFKKYIDEVTAGGQTPLYDSLNTGINELENIKKVYPKCRLRMLCLTDGNDVGSKSDPVETAKKLITAKIVVDSVIIGDTENYILHGISNVTGGCCFKPKTSIDAMKLFEMETVLSLEKRKPKNKYEASSLKNLNDLTMIFNTHGYDVEPETQIPEEMTKSVASTQVVLKKNKQDKHKRIFQEISALHCSPHPYIKIYPSENRFDFWKILLMGPPDTPYENGVFLLYCQFPPEYPVKPPEMRFFTSIYHCNVNSAGRICHNIFDRGYTAHITMKQILEAVYGLLIAPEPDDPLDSILAEEYLTSRGKYLEEARKKTAEHASTSFQEMENRVLGLNTVEDPTPKPMVCPLSKQLFIDPVQTPGGDIYERKDIELHLKRNNTDPVTNKPLHNRDLKPCPEMKKMVEHFRKKQIQETSL